MPILAGMDGCIGGWLCLIRDTDTDSMELRVLSSISELKGIHPLPTLVSIDIPIGLPDSGPRECDLEARQLLQKPRSNSVFPAPIRPVLQAKDFREATQVRKAIDGKSMSIQAWSIVPKIVEVDEFLRSVEGGSMSLREIHPELSFYAWNGGRPMSHPKRSSEGRAQREVLVTSHFGEGYANMLKVPARGRYANDDLLDAFAALWTAERLSSGKAITIPANPPRDSHNLPMEMNA